MIAKVSRELPRVSRDLSSTVSGDEVFVDPVAAPAHISLLQVLWRRRWVLMITLVMVLAGAGVYLLAATPVYTASSGLYIEQTNFKVMTDAQGFVGKSDSFLYTQAEIIKSAPILSAALEKVDYRQMKTFAKVDNPVAWLQMGHGFSAEVGKKDDVVTVSLDSPYPQEAADIVNNIVDAYMTSQGARKKSNAAEMLKVLQKEKENRNNELSDKIKAMLQFKAQNGALSFRDDKGNIILQRLARLSDTLTNLELATVQIRSEYETAKSTLQDPIKMRAYVEKLAKGGGGDKEYEESRSDLHKYQMAVFTLSQVHGVNSQPVQIVRSNIVGLKAALLEKERAITEEWVTQLEQDLKGAQSQEDQVRAAFLSQQKDALELNSKEAEYARLEEEVQRTEKQCGDLDNRVKEVTVNSEGDSGTLNIQVVESAKAEDKPSKPRKTLTAGISLLAGLVLGCAMSLLWDWVDQRIRTPDEITDALGISILGVVPQMTGPKGQVARGQYVHLQPRSVVAEAYRTIRTAVHFGSQEAIKTVLITSPAPGDGKSTTASNLAIALAQAGHRTLLLDADLRRPVQHKIFEVDAARGLSSVVQGECKLRDAIRSTVIPRLDVLPCGPVPSNPSEIIAGNRFAQVVRALSEAFDRVVIDSPPVMAVTDGRILAASADVTVLVLRTNRSTRKGSRLALEALLSTGANVIGTVVNAMPQQAGVYAYYGRYGSYKTAYQSDRPHEIESHQADPAESALGQLPEESLLLPSGNESLPEDAVLLS